MNIVSGIRNFFNNIARQWELGKQYRQASEDMVVALYANDAMRIQDIMEQIEDREDFLKTYVANPDPDQFFSSGITSVNTLLLNVALRCKIGGLDMFKAIYDLNPDPNYMLQFDDHVAEISISKKTPLFLAAVEAGREDIATFIASQEGFDAENATTEIITEPFYRKDKLDLDGLLADKNMPRLLPVMQNALGTLSPPAPA